jgi:hypothetical protein
MTTDPTGYLPPVKADDHWEPTPLGDELLRKYSAWAKEHDCKAEMCSIQEDPCGGCCGCLSECVWEPFPLADPDAFPLSDAGEGC